MSKITVDTKQNIAAFVLSAVKGGPKYGFCTPEKAKKISHKFGVSITEGSFNVETVVNYMAEKKIYHIYNHETGDNETLDDRFFSVGLPIEKVVIDYNYNDQDGPFSTEDTSYAEYFIQCKIGDTRIQFRIDSYMNGSGVYTFEKEVKCIYYGDDEAKRIYDRYGKEGDEYIDSYEVDLLEYLTANIEGIKV